MANDEEIMATNMANVVKKMPYINHPCLGRVHIYHLRDDWGMVQMALGITHMISAYIGYIMRILHGRRIKSFGDDS
jgi:hypothetical protein